MKDKQGNLVSETKFYKNKTAEIAVDFKGNKETLTVDFESILIGERGQLIVGLWEFENGKWSETITNAAPKSAEEAKNFHSLTVRLGHEKEKEMIRTIRIARDMAFESGGYNPKSEFEKISFEYNFKEYKDYEVYPKEWKVINSSRKFVTSMRFQPVSRDSVGTEGGTKGSIARPMQIALGAGWFNLRIFNSDGTEQPMAVHAPIVAVNADKSLVNSSSVLRQESLSKIADLLTKEKRGNLLFYLFVESTENTYGYGLYDELLTRLMKSANSEFKEKIGMPKLGDGVSTTDETWTWQSLPKELSSSLFAVFISP